MSRSTPIWKLVVVSLASACTPQRPSVVSTPASTSSSAPRSVDSVLAPTGSSYGIYQPHDAGYTFRLKSVIQTATEDSIPRVDSSRLTAILSLKYSPVSQSRFIRGAMTTDSVALSTFAPLSAPTVILPNQSYSIDIDPLNGRTTVNGSRQACTQEGVDGPFRGDEVTPAIPLSSTQTWTDTSTFTACRGGVLLHFTRISSYRRDAALNSTMGDSVTRVFRAVDLTLTGAGTQWQQVVEATGHGVSVDTLWIRSTPPQLQAISSAARLELFFKSALRSQHFVQTTTTRIIAQESSR
jgi:hypothetical protein